MKSVYSVYEAKAKLSEILRRVKENRVVVITERGKEVAKVVPIARTSGLKGRLTELEEAGALTRARGLPKDVTPIGRRSGALARFLEERNED